MSYSRKKTNGWLRTYFLEPPPVEFFIYLLYPWKFQIYQSFTPGNCAKLRYISLGNCKTKNRDPCKFHIIFSWSPLKIPHAFLCLIPLEIPYSQPHPTVWIFSGIAQCKEGVYFFFIWFWVIFHQSWVCLLRNGRSGVVWARGGGGVWGFA